MGIRGLTRFISPCGKLVTYDAYAGQYLAVDAFHRIYKYCSMKDMSDPQCEFAYIRAIISCASHLAQFKIIPFFVFDGMALKYKLKNKEHPVKQMSEQIDPVEQAEQAEQKEHSSDSEKETKWFKLSPQNIKECQEFIKFLGYPSIRAPHEADSQCAAMTMRQNFDKIDAIITDDTDALVFGANAILKMLCIKSVNLLRNIFATFLRTNTINGYYSINDILENLGWLHLKKRIQCELDINYKYSMQQIKDMSDMTTIRFALKISLPDVLEYLKYRTNMILRDNNKTQITEFSYNDFVNLCLLSGTDYSPRVCITSIEHIFKYFVECNFDTMEVLANKNTTTLSTDEFKQRISDVREYYMNASVIDPNSIDMRVYKPHRVELMKLLMKYGIERLFAEQIIRKYENSFGKLAYEARANT
jgi:5'-3' exonuclease